MKPAGIDWFHAGGKVDEDQLHLLKLRVLQEPGDHQEPDVNIYSSYWS